MRSRAKTRLSLFISWKSRSDLRDFKNIFCGSNTRFWPTE